MRELNAAVEWHGGATADVRHSFGDASMLAQVLVDEWAGQIAVESHGLIARDTQEGMFVLPLASSLAGAHV